ncbi:MAG TPA: bifunctional enoyl-CoA hydratase/phosphate acetyltransferase [Rhodospirillales bacterium]|nr:bifunctional enoyl-CoA hydratase/phosphate acetyltransferase [Rhodospirillales bacterium]
MIENRTFDAIHVGETASLVRAFRRDDIETWAAVTGNVNLVDLDPSPAESSMFPQGAGQAMWAAALFSTITDTRLPGLGSVTTAADIHFLRPVPIGQPLTATATVREKRPETATVVLDCACTDESGQELLVGTLEVAAPRQKIRHPLRLLPKVQLRREDRYLELISMCEGLPPLRTAVVHPCSADALEGAVEAAERNLITPILVGPENKIRAVAAEAKIDIGAYALVPADHSHHAAELAVKMVHAGEVAALMKGSLHTDELLHEVMKKDGGLRTERRLSHCFLIAVPTYARPIIVTDAAITILPSLEDKRDICQNAIELAHALGIAQPKVAILSAVETVTPKIPSTIDAAALCKMADRGQIKGGLVDGPLAFDNAIDVDAAATKGIVSPVAGRADILVVPNLEAGNMIAKQLTFMANAEAAGIVIGARVPIVLTSRADSARARLASCALAVLFAAALARGVALRKAAE